MDRSHLKQRFLFVEDFVRSSFELKDPKEMIEASKGFYNDFMVAIQEMMEEEEDVQEAIFYVQEMINKELEKVCKKNGISMETMQKLIQDPKNFKPQDWKALQDMKTELSNRGKKQEKVKKNKKLKKKNWSAV